ncbi:hypothetical protein Pint_33366 [Pistacia integerrima]|uniref:Uncharacterized protein n=1 Tax=Pistacia integerrima TaxID=434235 RepID=A0ACC0X4T4_9ROSI|nr:hypothetical protein Pint_33366 [Pistacia integerrima]
MASTTTICLANSVLSLKSQRPNALSLPKSNLQFFQFKKNNNNTARFTTVCSLEAKDPKQDTPIELRYEAFPTVMDINQIREILPHRFPFLLVDRVIEYNPGVSAVGIKNVTINDNFFPGHFPERPIMPGVLMIEMQNN